MDEINTTSVVTPEEQNAEKEFTREVTDEELREKVVADFGLNPEENKDLIDKLVADKKANHEKLSSAIKQKINWRNKVTTEKKPDNNGGSLKEEDISKLVDQRMAERELESMSLSDDLKSEIKRVAKLENISIRDASKLPYMQFKIQEAEKEERIKNGTPKRTSAGGQTVLIDTSKSLNPEDFKTADGNIDIKAWNEAKAERAKKRQ
jgi:hypothetical protein